MDLEPDKEQPGTVIMSVDELETSVLMDMADADEAIMREVEGLEVEPKAEYPRMLRIPARSLGKLARLVVPVEMQITEMRDPAKVKAAHQMARDIVARAARSRD